MRIDQMYIISIFLLYRSEWFLSHFFIFLLAKKRSSNRKIRLLILVVECHSSIIEENTDIGWTFYFLPISEEDIKVEIKDNSNHISPRHIKDTVDLISKPLANTWNSEIVQNKISKYTKTCWCNTKHLSENSKTN